MTSGDARTIDILRVAGIAKSFGAVSVLSEVSFSIRSGELVGIIGPNGSGKTTLFGVIAGHLRPNAGSVSLLGRDVTRDGPASRARAGVGRCFQVPQAFGSMSVFENLLTAAIFAGGATPAEAEDEVAAIMALTGFVGREMMLAEALPLLDRKRLELARALATRPALLLLDEIAGGLTDDEAFELADLVIDLVARGITVIWVEHLMHVLVRAADRIIVLGEGRIIADGEPNQTLADAAVRKLYMGIGADA